MSKSEPTTDQLLAVLTAMHARVKADGYVQAYHTLIAQEAGIVLPPERNLFDRTIQSLIDIGLVERSWLVRPDSSAGNRPGDVPFYKLLIGQVDKDQLAAILEARSVQRLRAILQAQLDEHLAAAHAVQAELSELEPDSADEPAGD